MIFSDILLAFSKVTGFGCATRVYSSHCLVWRILLLFVNLSLSTFDCYSDWHVWVTIREIGFNHPLLQIPTHWTRAWLVFISVGTATAGLYVLNELSGVLLFYHQYRNPDRDADKADLCRPCIARGCNYITRAEVIALVNITLEDLPLLVLSLVFAAVKYSCNHPTPEDNSAISSLVFVSSLASFLDVGWSLLRFIFRMGLRACSHHIKTKVTKSRKWRSTTHQLYPKHRKMKLCLTCHSITLMLVYGLTIGISVTAIALTQHRGALTGMFLVDSSQELSIYRSYPQEQLLINVSTIMDNENGVCLKEAFTLPDNSNQTLTCDLVFLHSQGEGKIFFNYDVNTTNSTNSHDSTHNCATYYEGMFLGHYTTEGVRRFDETCLGVLILFDNDALLQRQEDLYC